MTPFSWMILSFAVLMAAVCGFTYVQIVRNEHQAKRGSPHKEHRPSPQD
jgi:hypothetical protein